jgi:hypothetical protein
VRRDLESRRAGNVQKTRSETIMATYDTTDPTRPEFWDAMDDTEPEEPTYKIVRFYQDRNVERETLDTGLTLEEAKAHCDDPEASSRTATSDEADARTEMYGAWFEGFYEE